MILLHQQDENTNNYQSPDQQRNETNNEFINPLTSKIHGNAMIEDYGYIRPVSMMPPVMNGYQIGYRPTMVMNRYPEYQFGHSPVMMMSSYPTDQFGHTPVMMMNSYPADQIGYSPRMMMSSYQTNQIGCSNYPMYLF